jgi:hypothetical protein
LVSRLFSPIGTRNIHYFSTASDNPSVFNYLKRLKKYCSPTDRGFLGFDETFTSGACPQRPVTSPKRKQNPGISRIPAN